jgi:hypothetical protein
MTVVIQPIEQRDGLIGRADQEAAPFELHDHHEAPVAQRQRFAKLQRPLAPADFNFAQRIANSGEQLGNRPQPSLVA